MKKNENFFKIEEDFYQASLFTFNSHCCFCAIDTINESPTETRKVIKVTSIPANPICFAFQPKDGLVRINLKTGAVEEKNILSSLTSIQEDKFEDYKKFFEKNGFFFPISNDKFEELNDESLLLIVDKMKKTLSLISQISEVQRKDYKKILDLTMDLLLATPLEFVLGGRIYRTCEHLFLRETLKKGSYKPDDRYFSCDENWMFVVEDSIYEKHLLHIDEYRHFMDDPDILSDLWREVLHSYVKFKDATADERLILEVLYHVYFDMRYFESYVKTDWSKFDEPLKQALLKVAKIVIAEEINSNLGDVYPEYDYKIMEPRWRVDSLMSALYFSLFYMRPNVEVTRICANPKCGGFFTVSRTSLKQKYCNTQCANRFNQNKYRARKKKQ